MILNTCVKNNKMEDENVCKACTDKSCNHAGELTTRERIEADPIAKKQWQTLMDKVWL